MVRSAFFEFNVASSGLFGARAALEVTSHNTANAATHGYARQYVQQRAGTPLTYHNGKGMIGTGVDTYGVGQIRDFYLDTKYWAESGVLNEYTGKSAQLTLLEGVFNEMSDTGISAGLDTFFANLQDLSTTAGDDTYRTNVVQTGETFTRFVNNTTETLKKQQRDMNEEIKTIVNTINNLGQQIRSLNEQINLSEMDGSNANDLRDARANVVDELSGYVNIDVTENANKFYVQANGYEFVSDQSMRPLEVISRKDEKRNPMDVTGLYDIYFANSGEKFDIYHPQLQGELKGLVDVRDGNNGNNLTTPRAGYNIAVTLPNAYATITIPSPNRTDIARPTGVLQFTDPTTGITKELVYDNANYDPATDVMTLQIASDELPSFLANADLTVGNTVSYKGIPHYLDKMNNLVRTFAKAINEGIDRNGNPIQGATGHINGYDANGMQNGSLFFSYDPTVTTGAITDYDRMTCENFQMNRLLQEQPNKLNASTAATAGVSSNDLVLEMIAQRENKSLFAEGKIGDFINGMAGELGVDTKQAKKFEESYTGLLATIDNQRISVSGVDINEEMSNMVKYNQIFQAAAKLIHVIDGIYDTTINHMGV